MDGAETTEEGSAQETNKANTNDSTNTNTTTAVTNATNATNSMNCLSDGNNSTADGCIDSEFEEDDIPQQQWRGSSLDEVYRHLNEFELDHVSAVKPSADHVVLHHYPIRETDDQPPRPLKAHHKWDAMHVRLPCSPKSQYPVSAPDGTTSIESRWEMIEKALLRPINDSIELQKAILSYNFKYEQTWEFYALHRLFKKELDESETRVFFEDLLPRIIRLALRLPDLVQAPIPLLKQGQNRSITLTQEQISCLLANAFLCTFPRRNTLKRKSEYGTFPDINFNNLFQSTGNSVLEKIKCICHYFRRVCPTERDASNVPTGVVTFTRRSLATTDLPNWSKCMAPLGSTPLHITSSGTIEDQGIGLLQVDFANKYLGGGVLGSGCVQEEIRFVICPELLISKLFTECLRPTEALLMVGAERYSNYTGYARTFMWAGNHEDCIARDTSRRRMTHIVAIDALNFVHPMHQYREELMLRELNKAYAGFFHPLATPPPGVASGNWGCGAFGGDAELKALLQLMVCAVAGRPLVYYTFGNEALRDKVHRIREFFIENQILVKDLWRVLRRFHTKNLEPSQLYDFLRSRLKSSPNGIAASNTWYAQGRRMSASSFVSISSTISNKASNSNFNQSQDIFLDSSSNDSIDTSPPIITSGSASVRTTPKRTMPCRMSSDDDATNALLMAAVDLEVNKQVAAGTSSVHTTPHKTNKTTPATPSRNKTGRQRTLLEMLDVFYTSDVGTAAGGGGGGGGGAIVTAGNRICNGNAAGSGGGGGKGGHSSSKRHCQAPLMRNE